MGKAGKQKRRQPPIQIEEVSLTAAQRGFLRGQLASATLAAMVLGCLTCFLLGVTLGPSCKGTDCALSLLIVALPGALWVAIVIWIVQFVQDLKMGVAQRRVDRLTVWRESRHADLLMFEQVGRLQVPHTHPSLSLRRSDGRLGELHMITYSPHSQTIWTISPISHSAPPRPDPQGAAR
jgi:hypothetical protein